MKHYYISLAAADNTALAAKGDVFLKGDRIASNWDGEWYLATVSKPLADDNFNIQYDTGDLYVYSGKYLKSAKIRKLPADTKKSKLAFTLAEVKKIAGVHTPVRSVMSITDLKAELKGLQKAKGVTKPSAAHTAKMAANVEKKLQAGKPLTTGPTAERIAKIVKDIKLGENSKNPTIIKLVAALRAELAILRKLL